MKVGKVRVELKTIGIAVIALNL